MISIRNVSKAYPNGFQALKDCTTHVEKGEVIGTVGTSGNASGPHLHFEVRRWREPQDPLLYLP